MGIKVDKTCPDCGRTNCAKMRGLQYLEERSPISPGGVMLEVHRDRLLLDLRPSGGPAFAVSFDSARQLAGNLMNALRQVRALFPSAMPAYSPEADAGYLREGLRANKGKAISTIVENAEQAAQIRALLTPEERGLIDFMTINAVPDEAFTDASEQRNADVEITPAETRVSMKVGRREMLFDVDQAEGVGTDLVLAARAVRSRANTDEQRFAMLRASLKLVPPGRKMVVACIGQEDRDKITAGLSPEELAKIEFRKIDLAEISEGGVLH